MDSKQVTKEINTIIRPFLKENGFKNFSGRTYWRYEEMKIDILNFQSFNSYLAEGLNCTTFSFSVNLSTLISYFPSETEIKEKNGLQRPLESQGHFRSQLNKGIRQVEFPRKDIWFIDNQGKHLNEAIIDCRTQISEFALDWFSKFRMKESVHRILLEDEPSSDGTWGFGNTNSPIRNKLTAYSALQLNQVDLAMEKLEKLLDFYKDEYAKMKYDYYLERVVEIEKLLFDTQTTHNNGYK